MFVTLEFDANLVVVDTQVTVAVTNHRLRHHLLHFLRHDADIGAVAAVIAEAGSELAERAVKDGIALAKSAGAKVTVIMVAELWFGSQPFMQPWSLQELRKYNEDIKKQVGSVLKRAEDAAKQAGVSCDTIQVEEVAPYQAIITAAAERGCDLIVMASHGRSGLSAVVLGSVTNKVLAHTKIPVLVVR
jgi:nucleotide-binding universal stress UspA family protein